VFSFGVVLYEMIAGRAPFTGSTTTDVLAAILDKEPPPLARYAPDVPNELQRIVGKTLRKDKNERYQTMKDVIGDLKDLRGELQVQDKLRDATNDETPTQPTRLMKAEATRNPAAAATAGAATGATTADAQSVGAKNGSRKVFMVAALFLCGALLLAAGVWAFRSWRNSRAEISVLSIAVARREVHRLSGEARRHDERHDRSERRRHVRTVNFR
jgi:serine/threonine-protein kinase